MHPVRAEIAKLDNMSAHADSRGLLDWMGQFRKPVRKAFVTHGEQAAAESLREKISTELGWDAIVPGIGDIAEL